MIQQEIKASCLFIGQDRAGHWVVKDAESLCGGLFANRTEAIRFAMYECQRRPRSVIMLPDGLEEIAALIENGNRAVCAAVNAKDGRSDPFRMAESAK
jgi:hypothetical protein